MASPCGAGPLPLAPPWPGAGACAGAELLAEPVVAGAARTDEEAGDTHEDDTEEDEEEDDEEEDGDEEAHTQRDARPSEARDGTPSGESAQDGAASHPASARPSRPVVLPRASACPNPLPW